MAKPILLSFTPRVRNRVQFDCGDERRTKQAFKDECDINNIVNRYKDTGQLPFNVRNNPIYQDVPANVDLKTSIDLVNAFKQDFDTLPPHVQEMFHNDPFAYADFLDDYERNPERYQVKPENSDSDLSETTSGHASQEPSETEEKVSKTGD